MHSIETGTGGICAPLGFSAAGTAAGIKQNGKRDIALVFSDTPCTFAGAYTSCNFKAAPVQLCLDRHSRVAEVRGIVANSGNANACTGAKGLENAEMTAKLAADALGVASEELLVSSTGRIGVQLPMEKIRKGVLKAAGNLSGDGGSDAAEAILTTDTRPKQAALALDANGKTIHLGAMAKGSGMIAPRLLTAPHATMLAFMTTDAAVSIEFLAQCVREGVAGSFNSITVDGDISTNDSFIALANGRAENKTLDGSCEGSAKFKTAFCALMSLLAEELVSDGEGCTKKVRVIAEKAASETEAELVARKIAESLLCKTAWFGEDPNWGRILAAAGAAEASFDPGRVELFLGGIKIVENGLPLECTAESLRNEMTKDFFTVRIVLNSGDSSHSILTCDISYDYVKINAEYHT